MIYDERRRVGEYSCFNTDDNEEVSPVHYEPHVLADGSKASIGDQ